MHCHRNPGLTGGRTPAAIRVMLGLREMTPEGREKRDLAIEQARESEKADAAEKAVKLRPLPARKK